MTFRWIFAAFASIAFAATANAQYPNKPIRMIVPFPPGTATDIMVRTVMQPISQQLGQPIPIDNKAGADGAIGALELIKAAPDGYTLMVGSSSALVATPLLRKQPPYDPASVFTPVSMLGNYNFFLLVNPDVPAKSLQELIAYAKANPKKLNYATGNTAGIIGLGQVAEIAGIDMVHVPYKGEPAGLLDVVAGRVQLMFATPATAMSFMKDGRLRALTTTTRTRSPLAPDIPTMAEGGMPGFGLVLFAAIVGPAKMPREIAERVSKEAAIALTRPEVIEALNKQGFEYGASSPDKTAEFLKNQTGFWSKAIRDAGIHPE